MRSKMKIIEKRLEDIRPYDNNPRLNDKAVPAVAESLKEFGWQQPIVIDRDGVIVAGHTRYKAALELGWKTAPCKYADELTPEQINAYRLADNKTAELAEWDAEKMAEELAKCADFDMSAFGFDEEEPEDPDEIIDDEYDENAADISKRTKPGEKYQLGDHILVCGDATKKKDIQELVGEERVRLLIADPPYNVGLGWHMRPSEAKALHRRTDGLVIDNDEMSDEEFLEFLKAGPEAAKTAMQDGAAFYIWHADTNGLTFRQACREAGLQVRQNLIWVKSNFAMGRQDYQWQHEPCLYGWKDGAAHYFTKDRTQATVLEDTRPNIAAMKKDEMRALLEKIYEDHAITTVIHEAKPSMSEMHPTMKPVPLIGRLIKNSSRPGDSLLDPYGGSGSTMIAAEQLNRRCYMMELDPHYCDVIIDRWEKFTGGKAELVDG